MTTELHRYRDYLRVLAQQAWPDRLRGKLDPSDLCHAPPVPEIRNSPLQHLGGVWC